jgi:hypothetical protein
MKKIIELKYLIPLEFVAMYAREELKFERAKLQEYVQLEILEIIEKISNNDIDGLIDKVFLKFAPEVGYEYCVDHNIFHEYEKCPFCQLGIRVD